MFNSMKTSLMYTLMSSLVHFFSTMPAHYTVVKDRSRESLLWPVSRMDPRISWWPPTSLVVVLISRTSLWSSTMTWPNLLKVGSLWRNSDFFLKKCGLFSSVKKKILLLDFARSSNGLAKFGSSSPFSNDIVLFVIMIFWRKKFLPIIDFHIVLACMMGQNFIYAHLLFWKEMVVIIIHMYMYKTVFP